MMFTRFAVITFMVLSPLSAFAQSELDIMTFISAAEKGDLHSVTAYLKSGYDPNKTLKRGGTALMVASASGKPDIAKMLIKYGADINMKTRNGHTALSFAATYGNADVTRILLQEGANLDAKTYKGMTAMKIATDKGHLNVVSAMMNWRMATLDRDLRVAGKL